MVEMTLIAVCIVGVYIIFFVPMNIRYTRALFVWPKLSRSERMLYTALLWLVPIVGQIVAYRKSHYGLVGQYGGGKNSGNIGMYGDGGGGGGGDF